MLHVFGLRGMVTSSYIFLTLMPEFKDITKHRLEWTYMRGHMSEFLA